jgi:glycosyltransferase involved in cell wall biosynthesis
MREELEREFGVPPSRIVVMQLGIDRIFPPSTGQRDWLRRRCGLSSRLFIVLFFGNVARYKGLDLLAQAFERIAKDTSAVLVIAGRCRDRTLRQELQAQLTPLLTARRAFWFDGFVPEEQVLHYFHGADLLAMPYRHIDQSAVVFMALATGLPVIATDVGTLRDYVPLTGGRVVEPGDPEALAKGIEAMLPRAREIDREHVVREAERFLWVETVRPLLGEYGGPG